MVPDRLAQGGPVAPGPLLLPDPHQLLFRSALPAATATVDLAEALGHPAAQARMLTDRAGQPLQLRAAADSDDEQGTFDGYACVWDVTDAYGTRFRRGCFSEGGLDEEAYPLLWMHDRWVVLGVFYASEDDHGLHITGRWDKTQVGQDARERARSGSAPGLSVGFVPLMVDPDDENTFTQCRLVETSQIVARMAAVPGASLVGVRGRQPQAPPAPASPEAEAAAARALLLLSEPVHR